MEYCIAQSIFKGKLSSDHEVEFLTIFNDIVKKHKTKTAILYEDDLNTKFISFEEMDIMSNRMARVFQRYSDRNKSEYKIIGVSLKPSEYLPVILLAIMKAGLAYLPIDTELPEDRLTHILEDSQPLMCIVEVTADISIYNNVLLFTDKQIILESENESGVIEIDNDESKIAIILYTSGSTGTPKGVKLQYSALMNRLTWQWKTLPYKQDEDYCIFKTALTFVDSVCEIWGPLLQGRTLTVIPKYVTKDPEKFVIILNKYKIQRIVLVPSLLKSFLMYLNFQQDKDCLKSLKLWICSGETLSPSLVQEFFIWFSKQNKVIANLYGSTEIMGDVTFYLITENDPYIYESKMPIGKPIDNNIVYIVNEDLCLLSHGEIGELLISGKNLANGYIHDNNSQKFINNPFSLEQGFSRIFRTGDYAKIENNHIFYEGRRDNQIKIRGHRIDITEIEKAVLKLSIVKNAVVLSSNVSESEQILLCFLVLNDKNLNTEIKEIKSILSKILLSYMIPEIIILDNIPLLINGKTDRQKLLEVYRTSHKFSESKICHYDYTDVSKEDLTKATILFKIIDSVLNLKNKNYLNIHSNFYELGGNSLNSVYTVLKLREKGLHIGITDFITATSMKSILDKIKVGNSTEIVEDVTDMNECVLEMLNESHKEDVINMITESFFRKADLERWLLPEIKKEDYFYLLQELWTPLVEANFSFILKSSSSNKILCVALNFDAREEPEVCIQSKLNIIFDFLEYLEKPIREKLPEGKNKIFHTFMMATNDNLNAAENVFLMRLMEQKCLEIAEKNNFVGIFTTNTSPLTQQLGTDVFKYEIMLDYQVNQYITPEGLKPFGKASNDQRAVVSWKKIGF
ncbi:PREDICTED: N-(5-amino-5-carboxypentanoyl)-L-cysteinyl-D-valine synthase [Ceratosolen solmsi marchali]|uniref:N-(5-amino-5-carboxypentanoyl)-L-cysteinyl-D- valine synthase n=1 Tax=Ceratosolen solmsi marchali TaxID=326594 RepID=A0AAJ6YNY3_9HYME|nr:PREDICTED: N-(5-amino-5-carboxypentanoyl)-L-cysteinyl-D-valine synthase [Ceratosolen solmsi marchali]